MGGFATEVEAVDADADVLSLPEDRRSSWQRWPISRFILSSTLRTKTALGRGGSGRLVPSLARAPFVAGHMAPATVQAGMVNLPPFCSFLLLAGGVVVGVVLARGAVAQLICRILRVGMVCRVVSRSARARRGIGVGRDGRKASHRPPVGRGRGARNETSPISSQKCNSQYYDIDSI